MVIFSSLWGVMIFLECVIFINELIKLEKNRYFLKWDNLRCICLDNKIVWF